MQKLNLRGRIDLACFKAALRGRHGFWRYLHSIADKTLNRHAAALSVAMALPTLSDSEVVPTSYFNEVKDRLDGLDGGVAESVWANVKDSAYGAVGDDETDDTAAIQAAQDAVEAAGGGFVLLPEGIYRVTGLTVGTNVALIGRGRRATQLRLINGSNAPVIQLKSATVHNVMLQGFGIIGNRANQTSSNARGISFVNTGIPIDESGAKHILRDLHIEYTYGDAVKLDVTDGSLYLENVYALHSNERGFNIAVPDSTFVGCIAGQSGLEGWQILTRGNNKFVGCKAFRSGRVTETNGTGFLITSDRNKFLGCESQDNKLHGYDLFQCDQVTVTGCLSDSNGFTSTELSQAGFRLNAATNCVVAGCVADNRGPSDLPAGGGNRYSLSLVTAPTDNYCQVASESPVTADLNGTTGATNIVIINGGPKFGAPIEMTTDGTSGGAKFGSAGDVHLYRGAANRLDLAAGDTLLLATDGATGGLRFGVGVDVHLYRGAAETLYLANGDSFRLAIESGVTGARPGTPWLGLTFFDTTIGKPIWYDGTNWVDATGATV